MAEYDVQRCSRKCSQTERELRPGEPYYSALVSDGNSLRRLDFAAESWAQPPAGAIAWWKSHMPGAGAKRMQWAPNDVLLEYFQLLEGDPAKADVRYVLGLLLVRRRIARWEHTESDEQGHEVMVLYCPRRETEFRVPVQMPAADRVTQIQEEISRLLITRP